MCVCNVVYCIEFGVMNIVVKIFSKFQVIYIYNGHWSLLFVFCKLVCKFNGSLLT
jgi:hypothetical protein